LCVLRVQPQLVTKMHVPVRAKVLWCRTGQEEHFLGAYFLFIYFSTAYIVEIQLIEALALLVEFQKILVKSR
jgi:hypothetical protein